MKELYENIYAKNFSFGKNWEKYLKKINNKKIEYAKKSLQHFLNLENLNEKTFIDFGSGSGLFSLSAILLGAKKVISIDIDKNSVKCALFLRQKYNIPSNKWEIKEGSILDQKFVNKLPKSDIIYSWGVLHHTGNMKQALNNISKLVNKKGLLYIAIYNDYKGFPNSKTWKKIKRIYNSSPRIIKEIFKISYSLVLITYKIIKLQNPVTLITKYNRKRGMSFYRDIEDWLGGYPYEYASRKDIIDFYKKKKFELKNIKKAKREECNEFLFLKT